MSTNSILEPVAISPHRIDPRTLPGFIYLKVLSLEQQIAFYRQVVGLQLNWRKEKSAGMGIDGRDLVRMTEIKDGRRYRRVTGMYHFAIRFPSRRELARVIARLYSLGWTNYPTDHIMTKTTYLDDPEGNNIELYAESPEDGVNVVSNGQFYVRRADGSISEGREALDLNALFAHLQQDDALNAPVPEETRMGHFHLYVADLQATRHFYHELLGFDDMGVAYNFRMGMVSAGGYHHHIGYNTWQGEGAPPPPPDALGLKLFTFNLPDEEELKRMEGLLQEQGVAYERQPVGLLLHDPSQNPLLLTTAGLSAESI